MFASESEQSSKRRAAVFDLHCTDSNGNRFIIEMQLAKQDFFMGRMLFYVSATITGSIHFALVVLPRFKKALEQCETTLDLWLFFECQILR
ncbi:MAG: Rpn family recombination-promoting nuclease/putative transposase [Fibromonadaceae bacterium]|nr:Rpn family recombination-promoting nuclease/putative transposase [Fibromonadaceae bacterium]